MDINRFEEFIVLAKCLNYSKAASLLYLTQPVLSRHIADLEQTLGGRLFARDTHKVSLTPFGELALEEISSFTASYHQAMRNIKKAADNLNSRLTVGFLGEAVRPFFGEFIRWLENHNPSYEAEYTAFTELDTLIRSVDSDNTDLGFVTNVDISRLEDMNLKWVANEPMYVVMAHSHPLAERESLSIADLSGEPLIGYDKSTNPHTALFQESLFRKHGAKMNVVQKVHNIETAMFYAGLQVGCFLVPRHLISLARDLKAVPLTDDDCYVSLYLIWKNTNVKASVKSFVKDFLAFFKEEEKK